MESIRLLINRWFASNWSWMLLFIVGGVIHWPQHDFWPLIVQGDLSRDLYVYFRTLVGDIPYRDYFYNYGPLMPYYYAFFYWLLGVHFISVNVAFILLNILSGYLIYLILLRLTSAPFAFLGAIWFWLFYDKVTFTFNFMGAIPLILLNVYLLLKYHQKSSSPILGGIVLSIVLLLFVKINIGMSMLASSFVCVAMSAISKRVSWGQLGKVLAAVFFLPLVVAGLVYGYLMFGLPGYYVKQCFPLSSAYLQFQPDVTLCFKHFFGMIAARLAGRESILLPTTIYSNLWAYRLFVGSMLVFLVMLAIKTYKKRAFASDSWILIITMLFLSHEFILLGVLYELWLPSPVFLCFAFWVAWRVLKEHSVLMYVWFFVMLGAVVCTISGGYSFKNKLVRAGSYYLPYDKLNVYSLNPPNWQLSFEETTNYLKAHLGRKEKFWAVPYEPIYYWILDRRSPTKETMFFDFVNMPDDQQKRIITDLEKQHINYIVLSNRVHSPEAGLGKFGQTNSKLLGDYIEQNFQPLITFGKWENPAIWSWDHATRVYIRKTMLDATKYLSK